MIILMVLLSTLVFLSFLMSELVMFFFVVYTRYISRLDRYRIYIFSVELYIYSMVSSKRQEE